MDGEILSRKQVEARVIERAMRDDQFRRALLENARGVLSRETGMPVPESVRIYVVEEEPGVFYLVLPAQEASPADQELSEAELRQVAAGGLESEFWDALYTRLNCIFH